MLSPERFRNDKSDVCAQLGAFARTKSSFVHTSCSSRRQNFRLLSAEEIPKDKSNVCTHPEPFAGHLLLLVTVETHSRSHKSHLPSAPNGHLNALFNEKGSASRLKDEPTSKGGCSHRASWLSHQRIRISISPAILSSLHRIRRSIACRTEAEPIASIQVRIGQR